MEQAPSAIGGGVVRVEKMQKQQRSSVPVAGSEQAPSDLEHSDLPDGLRTRVRGACMHISKQLRGQRQVAKTPHDVAPHVHSWQGAWVQGQATSQQFGGGVHITIVEPLHP